MQFSIISATSRISRFIYIYLLHQLMTKRICLNKLHRTLLIEKSILNWNLEKKEYKISWKWDFLEVPSIHRGEGKKFVIGYEF